jgi:uncharacterized protein
LLQHGADSKSASATGNTPLILVARTGMVEIVQELLNRHADPNVRNRQGFSLLINGSGSGGEHRNCPSASAKWGRPEGPHRRRETAADIAAAAGHEQVAEILTVKKSFSFLGGF